MTLILAARCADGLLMAADSQGSETAGGVVMKTPVDKIRRLADEIIWASSGSGGTAQPVGDALNNWAGSNGDAIRQTPIQQLRPMIVDVIGGALKQVYGATILPGGNPAGLPTASFLLAGITGSANGQWILEVEWNATATQYEELGFHAIGSGSNMARLAHATLLHYGLRDRPLSQGRVVAYRMMDSVIESIETVSFPIHMWVQDGDSFRQLSTEEMQGIKDSVGFWKAIERETLTDAVRSGVESSSGQIEAPETTPAEQPHSTD